MTKPWVFLLAALVLASALATTAEAKASGGPETVAVHNGSVTLHALIWRPQGRGPFPAILLNHGSGRTPEELERLGPYEQQAYILGPMFARHGYVFMFLFRRGVGRHPGPGWPSPGLAPVTKLGWIENTKPLAGQNLKLGIPPSPKLGSAVAT